MLSSMSQSVVPPIFGSRLFYVQHPIRLRYLTYLHAMLLLANPQLFRHMSKPWSIRAQPKRQLSNVRAFGEEAASVPGSPAVVMTHTGSRDDPEVWRPPTPVWPTDDCADSPQPYTVSLLPRCLLSVLTCTWTFALSLTLVCSQSAGLPLSSRFGTCKCQGCCRGASSIATRVYSA